MENYNVQQTKEFQLKAEALNQEIAEEERLLAERKKLAEAYALVALDMSGSKPSQANGTHVPKKRRAKKKGDGNKTDLVREAIKATAKPYFGLDDIDAHLKKAGQTMDRQDISFVLYRLKKLEEISLHTKGGPHSPAKYTVLNK